MQPHLVLVLALATLATCGGGSGEISVDDFLARYPQSYCAYVFRCCDSTERSWGGEEACRTAVGETVDELLAFRGSTDVFATFVPSAAQSCLDRLDRLAKSRDCAAEPKLVGGCAAEAVSPQHKDGEECRYSSECSSSYCVQSQKHALGTCGPTGSSNCSGDDRSCGGASYCDPNQRQCVPKLDLGKPCSRPEECESGICSPTIRVCTAKLDPYCDG